MDKMTRNLLDINRQMNCKSKRISFPHPNQMELYLQIVGKPIYKYVFLTKQLYIMPWWFTQTYNNSSNDGRQYNEER